MSGPTGASRKLSSTPAMLDLAQCLTGLALALFMWAHQLLVSSILLGKDAMYDVSGMLEARFLSDGEHGYPILVSIGGILVFALFIVHAGIALRKFPSSWRQHRDLRDSMRIMKHADTKLWYVQALTGFIMFFLGPVHMYTMITHADMIGPYASADRLIYEYAWPLDLLLLVSVHVHGTIGLYRLAVKWGIFDGKNPRATRKRLKKLMMAVMVLLITIGLLSFAAYVKIGLEHRDHVGERYTARHPSVQSTAGLLPGSEGVSR